jgi:hypothetical protein
MVFPNQLLKTNYNHISIYLLKLFAAIVCSNFKNYRNKSSIIIKNGVLFDFIRPRVLKMASFEEQ